MKELIENLKGQLIEQLNLLDLKPEDIKDDEIIFGEGLELDSIDALEIVVLMEKDYGIKVEDVDGLRPHFENLTTLAQYISDNRTK